MYCSACGTKLDPNRGACGTCGHRTAPRGALTPGAVSTEASLSLPSYAEITASPIELPVADLVREAWRRAPIGTLVIRAGVLMFVALAMLALPPGFLLFPLLVPALAGGLYIMALRALRGDPVYLKHAFAGFKQFLPLLGVSLAQGFAAIVGAILPAGIAAAVTFKHSPLGPKSSSWFSSWVPGGEFVAPLSKAFAVGSAVFALFAVFFAMLCFWSTWLVLDREESVSNALDASVRVVLAHRVPMLKLWLALFALNAVVLLPTLWLWFALFELNVIGFLAILIGALLTVPFSFVVLGCAYERLFGIAGGATRLSA